jgi:hypothetical protein
MTADRNGKKSGSGLTSYFTKKLRSDSSGMARHSTESLVPQRRQPDLQQQRTADPPQQNASSNASKPAQQRSYASAAGSGLKRPGRATTDRPRPQLVRGEPVVEHDLYASMARPAPHAANPLFLYIDLRDSSLTADEAIDAADAHLGAEAIGFQYFAAQHTLAIIFSSKTSRDQFVDKRIPETDLFLYAAPSQPCKLMRLTLQGVPVHDKDGLVSTLRKQFTSIGELVFLAPMMRGRLMSDQWHATLRVQPDAPVQLPPETIMVLGEPVIVDVPGERRFCRHCNSSVHIKASCRQGQRIRSRQQQQQQDQRRLDTILQAEGSLPNDPSSWSEDSSTPSSPPSSQSPPPPPSQDDQLQSSVEKGDAFMEDAHPSHHQHREAIATALQVASTARLSPESVPANELAAALEFLASVGIREGKSTQ